MQDIFKLIETEIKNYIDGQIEIAPGIYHSQYETLKRWQFKKNCQYESGPKDSLGNFKYYYDIISPAVDTEVKNVDFDSKDVRYRSDSLLDNTKMFLANLGLVRWIKESGEAERINQAVESNAEDGNIIWKKVKKGYEILDLMNVVITNQAAKTLKDTAVIERHLLTQSQLREKVGVWNEQAVQNTIEYCSTIKKSSFWDELASYQDSETPFYEVYERNGEVSLETLKLANGETPAKGDEKKYTLAKIIVSGMGVSHNGDKDTNYVLFARKIRKMADVYSEAHRGRWKGAWLRKGLYGILFNLQVEANEVGNLIANGLRFAARNIYRSSDELIAQNILTDLQNGDIIKSKDLQQIETRMQNFDQLIARWNQIIQQRDQLASSFEVAQGDNLPSGTPFRLGALMNVNANKLYDFIREKLSLGLSVVYNEWVYDDVIADMDAKDIIQITGDPEFMRRFKEQVVNGWYISNLFALPPHTQEMAQMLKDQMMGQLEKKSSLFVKTIKEMWKDFKARIDIIITGEQYNKNAKVESLANFIGLEADPIRRTALVEMAMAELGFDIVGLPKSTPENIQPVNSQPQQRQVATQSLQPQGQAV